MNKIFTTLFLLFIAQYAFAGVSYNTQSVTLSSGTYSSNNGNIGTFVPGALTLQGGAGTVFQDGTDDACKGIMSYSVSGGTSGSLNLNFISENINSDRDGTKQFGNSGQNINISNLSDGTYTITLNYSIDGEFGGSLCSNNSDANNTFSTATLETFSLTFTISSALPVEFSIFEINKENNKNSQLLWQTTTELNNSHFNIQRSPNGDAWKTIGQVKGSGTTDEPREYKYMDEKPLPGMNYYRLEQVDYDGTTDYSWVVSTSVKGDFTVIPNPSTDQDVIQLFFNEPATVGSTLTILDASGKVVLTRKLSTQQSYLEVNLQNLPTGLYLARLVLPNGEIGVQGKLLKK